VVPVGGELKGGQEDQPPSNRHSLSLWVNEHQTDQELEKKDEDLERKYTLIAGTRETIATGGGGAGHLLAIGKDPFLPRINLISMTSMIGTTGMTNTMIGTREQGKGHIENLLTVTFEEVRTAEAENKNMEIVHIAMRPIDFQMRQGMKKDRGQQKQDPRDEMPEMFLRNVLLPSVGVSLDIDINSQCVCLIKVK
jgi:hypothetical protein